MSFMLKKAKFVHVRCNQEERCDIREYIAESCRGVNKAVEHRETCLFVQWKGQFSPGEPLPALLNPCTLLSKYQHNSHMEKFGVVWTLN